MKSARRILMLIFGVAIVLPVIIILFVPIPENLTTIRTQEYKVATAAVSVVAWLYAGAVILFLTGLRGFKEQFRRAYKAICVGLALYGVSFLQFPVIATFNLWDSPWAQNGGKALPLIIASVAIFTGLRQFALALNIRSRLTNFSILALVPLIAIPGGWLIEESQRISLIGDLLCVTITTILVLLAIRIQRAAGPAYKKSLRWLSILLITNLTAMALPPIIHILHITEGAFVTLPFMIASILSVVAGYSFNKIGESFTLSDTTFKGEARAVDVVLYLSSLASDAKAVAPLLDDLRIITAKAPTDRQLSDGEQQTLAGIYRQLITYLAEQDPLHVFDRPLLINKIQKRFANKRANEAIFWQSIA